MQDFFKALKPLRRKLLIEIIVNYFIIGLIISLGLISVVIILSKFIFINNIINKLFVCVILGLTFSILMIILKNPNIYEVAKVGDSLGFKERFITTLELSKNKDNIMYPLVLKDALEQAQNADFNSLYKINISNKKYIALIIALIVTIVSGFMPAVKAEQIQKQSDFEQMIDEKLNEIDEVSKQIDDNKLKEQLKELSKDLKKVSSESEVIKAVQKTQYKLKEIENTSAVKPLKQLGEQLAKNEFTKQLGESLQNLSAKDLKNQLDDLKSKLQNMSNDDLKKLADEMQNLAQQLEQNSEFQSLMKDFANALASTDSQQINNSLNDLSNAIDEALTKNKELKEAMDKINQVLGNSETNSNQSSPQKGNSNSQNVTSNGNGNSPNSGRGKGSIENTQQDMNSLDLETEKIYVKGKLNENGNMQKIEQKGDGTAGQIVMYDKVYNEYKQEALKSLNSEDIPEGMKSLVEDYFSSLEQE